MRGVRKVMRPKFTYQTGAGVYQFDKDEILHRDGEWFLRAAPLLETEWKSYIHHRVEKNIVQQNPWINGQRPNPLTYLKKIGCEWADLPFNRNHCTKCHNTIPEGLMGLWTMHNWDSLKRRNQ